MSFYNATKNPFPFYPLEGEVWTNKKPLWFSNSCKFQYQKYPIFPGRRYFQLRVSDNLQAQADVNEVNLRKVSDNTIVAAEITRTLFVLQKPSRKYVVLEVEIPTDYVDASFYISVETNYGFYYSEPFCVKEPNDSVGIVWSNSKGRIGDLLYPANFRHFINVEAEIIPLEPIIEEETIENGFGEEKPTSQILKQGFTFSFIAPNYLAQALSALRLHDQIQIINRQRYDFDEDFDEDITDVQVKVTNEEDGCFSLVNISYVEETIISTACSDEILAANSPPQADIVWADTQTTEERVCNNQNGDPNACSQTLLVTEMTFDPDDNLDTLEWQRSAFGGLTWSNLGMASGVGDTLLVPETNEGTFYYRLKAVDTFGAIGYSNKLIHKVFTNVAFAEVYQTNDIECGDYGYAKVFDIVGDVSQNVKIKTQVLSTYGHGFTLTIYDRLTGNSVLSWSGGAAGTSREDIFTLDGAGAGRYRVELCLRACLNIEYTQASVELRLFKDDNANLGDSKFTVNAFRSC